MEILLHNTRHPEFLCLGTQTNKGNTWPKAHELAKVWSPSRAKSYTIKNFRHTDYHGNYSPEETGFSHFEVIYYTTKAEGENKI